MEQYPASADESLRSTDVLLFPHPILLIRCSPSGFLFSITWTYHFSSNHYPPLKFLIVEDSPTTRLFMTRALQRAGYTTSIAVDAIEGKEKALREHPHCILLDVVLPGGSGFALCRQLRSADPTHSLCIIIVSTKGTAMDRTWGLRQGADFYLVKPFSEEVLLQTVREVLSRSTRSQPLQ